MSLLFNLPEELLLSLLSPWLHIGTIARLDSALSNHSLRPQFLRIISSPRANLLCPVEVENETMEDGFMGWIMRRLVAFSGIWVTESAAENKTFWRAYLRTHGKNLQWVMFIDYCDDDSDEQYYEDRIYQELVRYCPNVTKLTTCTRVSTKGLKILTAGLKNLQHIKLNEWPCSKRLSALRGSCSRLKSIEMDMCRASNEQMRTFVLNCPVLEEFSCECGSSLDNAFVQMLARSCPLLRNLYISQADLDDATLRVLANNCPHLESCPLDSRLLSAEAMLYLTSKCPNLKRFSAYHRWDLIRIPTEAEVLAVLENCQRVEQLYIGRCDLFTDATLRAVARFCPNLKRLHLAVFTAATDDDMIAVAKACSQLEEVKMANSARLTDASVEALMNNCPLLRVFVADAATAITPSTRAKMKKFCSLNCDRCNLQYLVDSPEL